MYFTDIFIRRPILALVISLLILLMGITAVFQLPVRQYPYLENATISVSTTLPGATQDVMQGFVTTPIAQSIASASGIQLASVKAADNAYPLRGHMKLRREGQPDAGKKDDGNVVDAEFEEVKKDKQ